MTATAGVRLRAADERDLDAISEVFLAAWHSYRGVLPDRVVDLFDESGARELWLSAMRDESRAFVVAERSDGAVAGVVASGRDPGEHETGHIFSLYVHPDAHGQGIGGMLLSAAVEAMRADGVGRASLWVFEANTTARDFYQRLGWQPDGSTRVEPRFGEPEIRMTRTIAP